MGITVGEQEAMGTSRRGTGRRCQGRHPKDRSEPGEGENTERASHKEGRADAKSPEREWSHLRDCKLFNLVSAHQAVNGHVKREKNAWGFLMRKDTERKAMEE